MSCSLVLFAWPTHGLKCFHRSLEILGLHIRGCTQESRARICDNPRLRGGRHIHLPHVNRYYLPSGLLERKNDLLGEPLCVFIRSYGCNTYCFTERLKS